MPERLSVAASPHDLVRALPKVTRSYDTLALSLKELNAEQRSFFATLLERACKQKLSMEVSVLPPLAPMPTMRSKSPPSSSQNRRATSADKLQPTSQDPGSAIVTQQ